MSTVEFLRLPRHSLSLNDVLLVVDENPRALKDGMGMAARWSFPIQIIIDNLRKISQSGSSRNYSVRNIDLFLLWVNRVIRNNEIQIKEKDMELAAHILDTMAPVEVLQEAVSHIWKYEDHYSSLYAENIININPHRHVHLLNEILAPYHEKMLNDPQCISEDSLFLNMFENHQKLNHFYHVFSLFGAHEMIIELLIFDMIAQFKRQGSIDEFLHIILCPQIMKDIAYAFNNEIEYQEELNGEISEFKTLFHAIFSNQ